MKDENLTINGRAGAQGINLDKPPKAILVRSGKLAYLWIGSDECFCTFSGPRTLEKLAREILNEIKRPRNKARR